MTEEIKIDEKFQKSALFDLEFERNEAKYAASNHETAESAKESADHNKSIEKEYAEWTNSFSLETDALKKVDNLLGLIQDPKLKEQATSYLNNLINKDDIDLKREQYKNKDKSVDLDGSKKNLWGKLKNKAKNFWRPNNEKKALESKIEALKEDMIKNPRIYDYLKSRAKDDDPNKKINFNDVAQTRNKDEQVYNDRRVESMLKKESDLRYAETMEQSAQKHEATIEAIHQVRDNAAKEMEQRSTARDTTGIKDTNANTGVDRLAEKAKAMEGLSPEQRLAKRMAEMRGTKKPDAPKPVVKREVDSNIMNRTMDNKMRA